MSNNADQNNLSPFIKIFWKVQQKYLSFSSNKVMYHSMNNSILFIYYFQICSAVYDIDVFQPIVRNVQGQDDKLVQLNELVPSKKSLEIMLKNLLYYAVLAL